MSREENMRQILTMLRWCCPAVLLFLVACHDAPRKNPFDPELTPSVELSRGQLDEIEGSVFLEWSGYEGRQLFAEYWVLRNIAKSTVVDTVGRIHQLRQTTFLDTSLKPNTLYEYRVAVVNQAGYEATTIPISIGPFSVHGVELVAYESDDRKGTIDLNWERYEGPDFERYEVWRGSFGQEDSLLAALGDMAQTTWSDTTPLPQIGYSYWVTTFAAGEKERSQTREISFSLPKIELLRTDISSETAVAELEWTRYDGSRFAGYEVIRRVPGESEKIVHRLTSSDSTSYTDTPLDGNTDYFYRIRVRTTWGANVYTESQELHGLFYGLERVNHLPSLSKEEVQAIGLALDEADRLCVVATMISTNIARQMQNGVRILLPGSLQYSPYFHHDDFQPMHLSPVHIAIQDRMVYVAVRLYGSDTLVGAVSLREEGNPEKWHMVAPTGDAFPAGLFFERDGDLVMIDEEGLLYGFTPDGKMAAPGEQGSPSEVRANLMGSYSLPVSHVAMGFGAGPYENDSLFMISPDRERHRLTGRTLIYMDDSSYIWGGRNWHFDDGVGLKNGETLNPRCIAFDPSRTRLVVLDDRGQLQVLDARDETERSKDAARYITKWGDFGAGRGEFLVDPPTSVAVAVDSQGRIYVADGEERIQTFVP